MIAALACAALAMPCMAAAADLLVTVAQATLPFALPPGLHGAFLGA